MNVSVIIINYKTPQLVVDCINSIFEKTNNLTYEVIVVDNDSQDNSRDIICGTFNNKIRYIQSEKNLGFGKANNLGAKYANGEYLFWLNSDTLLVNNAIKELYDYISNDKECGIVGGNLFTADMKPNSSYSIKFNTLNQIKAESTWKFIFKTKLQRFTKKNARIDFNYSLVPIEVAYLYGADMMISKKLFNQIGGFDDDFFMYYEEQELSFRVNQLGYKSICIPNSKIIHFDGMSTKKNDSFNERQFRMRLNGAMIFYRKIYGFNGLDKYYVYKLKNINKQLLLSKMMRKKETISILTKQRQCLTEEYKKLSKQRGTKCR